MKLHIPPQVVLFLALAACATTPTEEPLLTLEGWGTMREVLREGHTFRRVNLQAVARENTWGIGSLEGLGGEVTVLNGDVSLAVIEDGALLQRPLDPQDRATLLVLATVNQWRERELPEVRSLGDLEVVLEKAVREAGFDPDEMPVPIRIEGDFENLTLHVLDHSCPIANPNGPPPLLWKGEHTTGRIVGIFAHGQQGLLTHHGQTMHLHGVAQTADGLQVSGHVDELTLGSGVRLYLPAASTETVKIGVEGT